MFAVYPRLWIPRASPSFDDRQHGLRVAGSSPLLQRRAELLHLVGYIACLRGRPDTSGMPMSEPDYTQADWAQEVQALREGDDPPPCPGRDRRGFYAPRGDDDGRQNRACKFCGFWQDVGKPPHTIIRYECPHGNGWGVADWKEPHESWDCLHCGKHYTPDEAVACPLERPNHIWHKAPEEGFQEDYNRFRVDLGLPPRPFGIL